MALELYGTASCPYTAELREDLEYRGRDFVEYDVEADPAALRRLRELAPGTAAVPVLVEDGKLCRSATAAARATWPCGAPARRDRRAPSRRSARSTCGFAASCRGSAFGPSCTGWRGATRWPAGCATARAACRCTSRAPLDALDAFARAVVAEAPPAATHRRRSTRSVAQPEGFAAFAIRESERGERLTTRISPDLPVCEDCLRELFDPADRRYLYPYITCTDCGPRYSIVLGAAVRPRRDDDGGLADVRALRGAVPRSRRPALPRPAAGLPGVRADLRAARRTGGEHGGPDDGLTGSSASRAARRRSTVRWRCCATVRSWPSRGSAAIISPATRRTRGAVAALARAQVPQGAAVRADGARPRRPPATLVELSAEAEALLTSSARPIVLAPAPPHAARDRAGQPRAGRDAAVHAAAAPALRAPARRACW